MINYLIRRVFTIIPVLLLISIISFIIIQLPPGDYVSRYLAEMEMQEELTQAERQRIEGLRERFGIDRPIYVQFFHWFSGFLRGDMGYSFARRQSVNEIIWGRMGYTLLISVGSLIFTWLVAFPIGLYSAVKQYSIGDYIFTAIGFLGLSIPNFLFALVLMFAGIHYFGLNVGGLFSREYAVAPWSWGKFLDLLQHIWIPIIVVGTAGTAGLIRIMRNNLIDELQKQYVMTARAKGVNEIKLIIKYPVRIAINPFLSTAGWLLPRLISGGIITAIVLNLPTTGPVLLDALMAQDMYLAGSIVFLLASLTVIGTLISDILLAWVDPRIRYD